MKPMGRGGVLSTFLKSPEKGHLENLKGGPWTQGDTGLSLTPTNLQGELWLWLHIICWAFMKGSSGEVSEGWSDVCTSCDSNMSHKCESGQWLV